MKLEKLIENRWHDIPLKNLNLYAVRGLTGQKGLDNKSDILACSAKMSAMMNLKMCLMFVCSGDTENKKNNNILKQEGSNQIG